MTIIYLKFQRILYILRVLGTFTNTWPLYPDVGKNEYILRNIYYYVATFILMAVWIPMIISAYKNRNDVGVLMKNMSHIAAITEAVLNSILCRIKKKQLQVNTFIIKKVFLIELLRFVDFMIFFFQRNLSMIVTFDDIYKEQV